MNEKKLRKKLKIMVVTFILLSIGLVCTSYVLASSIIKIHNNYFVMNKGLKLELSNGEAVIDMSDVVFEPGGNYKSDFSITNLSDFDVWYRISFINVSGELKDYVIVKVKEENGIVLCDGLISKLTKGDVSTGSLSAGEEKKLIIEFYFLKNVGNNYQGKTVTFNIKADATQKQNNSVKDFGD